MTSIEDEARAIADRINEQAEEMFAKGDESAHGVDEDSYVSGYIAGVDRAQEPVENTEGDEGDD